MAQIYLCDCCGEQIKQDERETSNLKGFRDLCMTCYDGLIDLKEVVKLTKKDILLQLKKIIKAHNG